MYTHLIKEESKAKYVARNQEHNANKGLILKDNRPQTQLYKKQKSVLNAQEGPVQLQKKKPTLSNKKVSSIVVQRVLAKGTEDKLVAAVKSNNKAKFKQIFRAADSGMDEMISCDVTFSQCRSRLANEGSMRQFLRTSHDTRHSTHGMGHIVKGAGGMEQEFAHPTAKSKAFYARRRTKKGNPRWIGHTGWDRARSKHVRAGKTIKGMRDRAIEFSYNSGAQPPFARNSVKKRIRKSPEAIARHNERERMKRKHSDYDPKSRQRYNAKWTPKRAKRGVSPDRGDLS